MTKTRTQQTWDHVNKSQAAHTCVDQPTQPCAVPECQDKAKELEALDQQIITLINRYYDLVAPTEEELGAAGENLWDDRREACELLTDSNAPLGKWYLAGDTLAYREMMAEEEKTGQGES